MNKRVVSIDYLRIFCAMAIVIIHVTSASLTYSSGASEAATIAMHLSTTLLAFAVPCFLMITGFVWLGNNKVCTYKSVSKNILKFFVVLFTVGLFYALLEIAFNTKALDFNSLVIAVKNVIDGNLWDHMWYVYAVLGVYLVLPVIKPFFEKSSLRDDIIVAFLGFLFTIALPYVERLADISVPVAFNLSGWIFYVIFGGLVAKHRELLKKHAKTVVPLSAVATVTAVVAILVKYLEARRFGVVTYKSISVFMMSAAILIMVSCISEQKIQEHRIINEVSACCFGIYLLHPFFINLMIKLFKINPIDFVWFVSIPLVCIGLFALSGIVTWVFRKIPIIGKLVF